MGQNLRPRYNLFIDENNPDTTNLCTDDAVQDYIKDKVPPEKIILGTPFYGRSFDNTDKEFGNTYKAVSTGGLGDGAYLYSSLPWDESDVDKDVVGAGSYTPSQRLLVSHDDPDTVALEVGYIKKNNLSGAMFWEASGDRTGDKLSRLHYLLKALRAGPLGQPGQLPEQQVQEHQGWAGWCEGFISDAR